MNLMHHRIAVFDFDGTLFGSPEKPSWWPWQGLWGRLESLSPPYVPEKPGADWWAAGVVHAARQAIADPETLTVMMTGRPPKLEHRVRALLNGVGLHFDHYYFSRGDSTLPFKLARLEELIQLNYEVRVVEMWEDRSEHIGPFEATIGKFPDVEARVHHVPRVVHEFENAPADTSYDRR